MLAFALWLLFVVQTALAGPSMQNAPAAVGERPSVAAPAAGAWVTEAGLYARVHGGPDDRGTVRRLADHAATAVPRLAEKIGVPTGGTIDIYVAPTQEDFARLQPGVPPDWADGTAWPQWGLVFLRAPSARPGTAEPLEQVLDHELVHVLLGRAFAPRTPPRWLQEGLAQYWAGEMGPKVSEDLASMLFGRDDLLSLSELSRGFHGDPVRARHAYAAAADFIGFLASDYGEGAVRGLIAGMARGQTFDEALTTVTGHSVAAVEADWRGRWADPALLLEAVASSNLLWGVAGALALIGAWRVRRRTRRTVARWEREEAWLREMEAREREREQEWLRAAREPGVTSHWVN